MAIIRMNYISDYKE